MVWSREAECQNFGKVKRNKKAVGGFLLVLLIAIVILIIFLYRRWNDVVDPNLKNYLLLGLDNAGKSTLLYTLKLGEIVTSIPTIGFNVATMQAKGYKIVSWDMGSKMNRTSMCKTLKDLRSVSGLVYVLDSKDEPRISNAKDELYWLLGQKELEGVKLLVLANKQDLPGALTKDQVIEELELEKIKDRKWHVQPTTIIQGVGIAEACKWLEIPHKVIKSKE